MERNIWMRAWAGGKDEIEKPRLRIGFVPLTDCAPLVYAKERGFFRRHGLEVELSREVSWASIRDKVAAGLLDAAQMLAPMVFSSTLGLGGLSTPMSTGLCLGLNGNAITVSNALADRMAAVDGDVLEHRPVRANALRRLIESDRAAGRPPLRFGVVFPASNHDLELRYWLASAGIDPDRDLELRVVNPSAMPMRMQEGSLDGYCVGEPWNNLATALGIGRPIIAKHEIWNHSPEKVLGVSRDWLGRHPETHRAMLRSLLEAAVEIDLHEHRLEVAHLIAGESFVDAPVEVVRRSLVEGPGVDGTVERSSHVFQRHAANHPWKSHGIWFVSQMLRWGYIEKPIDVAELVDEVYRPDLHRQAAADLGYAAPLIDFRREGRHTGPWILEEATEPIPMGADLFFDGMTFDPHDVVSYLEGFPISSMRVRMDELGALNDPRATHDTVPGK